MTYKVTLGHLNGEPVLILKNPKDQVIISIEEDQYRYLLETTHIEEEQVQPFPLQD